MSDLVQQFTCVVPAGTPIATPVTFQCQLGVAVLDRIRWRVPRGFNGRVGFYIASSGQQVIPFRSGASPIWIVANDESDVIELTGQADSGDWQIVAYNLGVNPHTIYASFYTDSGGIAVPPPVPSALPASALAAP